MLNRRNIIIGATAALAAPAIAQGKEQITYLYPAPGNLPAFSPFAIARAKGYYDAAGLEINWQLGRGGVDVGKQLAAGNAQLGGGIGDTAIILRAQGANVKGVGLLGGRTLSQIYVRADSGIDNLDQLKGKKIGVLAFQDTTYFNLLGAMRSRGLKRDDVDVQAVGPAGMVQLLISGAIQGISGVPEWAASVQRANVPLKMFNIDTIFPAMAQAIMASDDMIAKRPETVKKFVQATLKGLNDVIANPAEMSKLYTTAVKEHAGNEAFIEYVMNRYKELVYPVATGSTLGKFDTKRVMDVQLFYKQSGIIEKEVPVNDLFSNDFA